MKTNQNIAVIFCLFFLISGIVTAYFLPGFISQNKPLANQAAIISFISISDDIQAYHLWLKLETNLEQLKRMQAISDTFLIRGFSSYDGIEQDPMGDFNGLPLRLYKFVIPSKENFCLLDNPERLTAPQIIPGQHFRSATDICYQIAEKGPVTLYIHLISGVKASGSSRLLSLTITYLRNNEVIKSETLPFFRY
jgi:hypothetical protein